MLLSLLDDKLIAWTNELAEVIKALSITRKQLESLIGKLTHASFVIPLSRHFLSRLQDKLQLMKKRNLPAQQGYRLNNKETEDFKLWKSLLKQTHESILLNRLTLRNPTRWGFSDSCPQGLGGYTHNCQAWRLAVNPDLLIYQNDSTNTVIEFLGLAITLWLSLEECSRLGLKDKIILILRDNTSAISWLFKTSLPTNSAYFEAVTFIARKLAKLVLESDNFVFTQHVPGVRNVRADWHSFDGIGQKDKSRKLKSNPVAFDKSPNDIVTHRIVSDFSQLVPKGFKISHLPKEFICFAMQALQLLKRSLMQERKDDSKPTTESGVG